MMASRPEGIFKAALRRRSSCVPARAGLLSLVVLAMMTGAGAQELALPDAPVSQARKWSYVETSPEVVTLPKAEVPGAETPMSSQTKNIVLPRTSPPANGRLPIVKVPCGAESMSSPRAASMSCWPDANPFQRFLNNEPAQPLTSRQKFRLAAKNVIDPFNLLTIAGDAAITVAANPRSHYGPGMMGWAKYSGVSLTQDMTAEFFVTGLVPSIAHQDPHFHRIPNASYRRRIAHCITQVVWAQSDTGKPMPNYAYLLGITAADTISNIYVPGRQQGTWPTAARVGVALGSAPIDNFVTEFLPDVARHVSIRIVIIQRIINRVALTDGQE